jgi:small subunit ribosomal protein S2
VAEDLVRELIKAGVHFGHGVNRWNPKMEPFIYRKQGDIHIIDVRKTLAGLLIAKKLLTETVASGRDVIFVGTKRQAQEPIRRVAERTGMHYVSGRWLGGMLTNFRTIRSRLQRLVQLEGMETEGQLESESKKLASRLKREMRKIRSNLEGVRQMSRLPGAVMVIDARKENLALHEAGKLGITTIGLIDTDSDPDTVDVAIPGNDDSIRAIELILNELGEAVEAGKTLSSVRREQEAARPKRGRARRPVLASANGQTAKSISPAEDSGGEATKRKDEVGQQAPGQ